SLLRGSGPGSGARLRPRVRRRLPELAPPGALLLPPLSHDLLQRAWLPAVGRAGGSEGLLAGPGRGRHSRSPGRPEDREGPCVRAFDGWLCDAPLRPAPPGARALAGRRGRGLRQRAGRPREVPRGRGADGAALRRGRSVPRAGDLHETQDPDGGARRHPEVGSHDQPGGAGGVQPHRARLPRRGGHGDVDTAQSRLADGLRDSSRRDTLMELPLAHITVVDLTRARSGPTAVRQLADMGANVIKVEAREEIEGDSTSPGFDFLNLPR